MSRIKAATATIAETNGVRIFDEAEDRREAGADDPLDEVAPLGNTKRKAKINSAAPAPFSVPIADFIGDEDEADQPEEMLVEALLPDGVVAFLAGEPKTTKTYLALYISMCIAAGRKVFDRFAVKQGAVVVICEEDTERQLRRRLWWLARGLGIDPRSIPMRIAVMKGFRIDEDSWLTRIKTEAKGAKAIVLDALTRIHVLDENSRTEMQLVTRKLTEELSINRLAEHHPDRNY